MIERGFHEQRIFYTALCRKVFRQVSAPHLTLGFFAMHRYPHEVSDALLERLTRSRQFEFDGLSGDPEELDQLKAYRSRIEPIPSSEHLRELLDAAFFSSLAQEEGQPVSFTLLFADPGVAIESAWPCIRLTTPLPLSTEHIRKLSPAAPPGTVDLAVFPHDGLLKIWGLLYVRSTSPGRRSCPPGLAITALQIGSLSVKFTDRELLSYSRGEAVFFHPDESSDAFGLRKLLAMVFADDRPFHEKYKTAATLLSMCSVPLDVGSGATLLVVPQDHEIVGMDDPRYQADEHTCKSLSAALVSPDQAHVVVAAARLLFIDGAVVFREGLGLLGAGAMIRTKDTSDFPIRIVAPHNHAAAPIETTLYGFNGGARHRSALAFCHSNPGALAVVVSQDGVMSLMVRPLREDCVYAFRPIRRGSQLE